MPVKLVGAAFAMALWLSPVHAASQQEEMLKAGGAAAAGAAVAGSAFAIVGSAGLAVAGTAVTVGLLPFVAAGTVVGLAGYGIYRVVADPDGKGEKAAPTQSSPSRK